MTLTLPAAELESLIQRAVDVALERFRAEVQANENGSGRLAFTEGEAAGRLGLQRHVLRDLRRRKLIGYRKLRGNRISYAESDLREFLASRHVAAEGGGK